MDEGKMSRSSYVKTAVIITARIRRKTEGNAFTFSTTWGKGVPHVHPIIFPVTGPMSLPGGYPSFRFFLRSLVPGPFPGRYPVPGRGVPQSQTGAPGQYRMGYHPGQDRMVFPLGQEQQSEYLLRGGRYAWRLKRLKFDLNIELIILNSILK